ncbi:MAG: hypothetical protein ACR2M1_13035 [Gemmatimonadaceae bacterium]
MSERRSRSGGTEAGGAIFAILVIVKAIEPGHPPIFSIQYIAYVAIAFVAMAVVSFLGAQLLWLLGMRSRRESPSPYES